MDLPLGSICLLPMFGIICSFSAVGIRFFWSFLWMCLAFAHCLVRDFGYYSTPLQVVRFLTQVWCSSHSSMVTLGGDTLPPLVLFFLLFCIGCWEIVVVSICDMRWHGAWSSSLCSLFFLLISEIKTAFVVHDHVTSDNACPWILWL